MNEKEVDLSKLNLVRGGQHLEGSSWNLLYGEPKYWEIERSYCDTTWKRVGVESGK